MLKLRIKWRDIFFLLIGSLIATFANNWTYFSFNKEVSLSDLFTALIGGYIGLYVGSKLSSKVSSDRVEKDLLISEVTTIRSNISRLLVLVEPGLLSLQDVITLFKTISQDISRLVEIIPLCSSDDKNIENDAQDVLTKVRALNSNITGISPSAGIITIDSLSLNQYVQSIRELNISILKIIIKINRINP